MALTRQEKEALTAQYQEWMEKSIAMVFVEYTGINMKELDSLRANIRESGGEFHIIKNTLAKLAFDAAGIQIGEGYLDRSTAVGFAFEDAPGLAKALADFDKSVESVRIKGGYLDKQLIGSDEIKALAELPPLPVVRAQILGTILAPAGKLVRTLAEPGRQVAAVLNAFAEKNSSSAAAA
ncbi:50S ribosomal protein L10 [Chloroflexota bacterium]